MQTTTDQQPPAPQLLLREWVLHRREEDFRSLVQQYYHLVFGVAFRRTGDRAASEDIAQMVFADLAREARTIRSETPGGWLVRHAGFLASRWQRGEIRRKARESAVAVLEEPSSAPRPGDASLPIDEAIAALPAAERDAVVLRFLEARDLRSVGMALGISGNAAQKRVTRGLERLRSFLAGKGFSGSTAGLGALISAAGTEQAPAASGKVAAVAAEALRQQSGALSGSGAGAGIAGFSIAAAAASFAIGAVPAFLWSGSPGTAPSATGSREIVGSLEHKDSRPGLEDLLSAADRAHTFAGKVRFDALISRLVPSDFPALLGAMGPRTGWPRAGHRLAGDLHTRWAAASPADCIAWHRAHPQDDSPSIIRSALSRMAESDAHAAVALAADILGMSPGNVISSLAWHDPETVLHRTAEFARLAADPKITPESLKLEALSYLFRNEPARAAELVASEIDKLDATTAPVFAQWAEVDARAAWKWAECLPQVDSDAMMKVFPRLLEKEPDLALQAAARRPDLVDRGTACAYAELLARKDPAAALRWYDTLQAEPVRITACTGLVASLPLQEARGLLAEIPGKELQDQIIAGALDHLPLAPARAEALAALGHVDWLLHNAVNSWQQSDPAAAWKAALEFESPARRLEALLLILKSEKLDAASKLQMVESLEDPGLQAKCREALRLESFRNPAAALAEANAAPDDLTRLRILSSMLERASESAWMTQSGAAVLRQTIEAAVGCVSINAASREAAAVVSEQAAVYLGKNYPGQAKAWIEEDMLKPGRELDLVLKKLASAQPGNPEKFALGLRINNPAERLDFLRRHYPYWIQSAPAEAAAALGAAALS